MENQHTSFFTFFWRITAAHMITYSIMGILASNLLNYEEIFDGSGIYRSMDSPWIPAGPVLQVVRGLVFALALWYFKDAFLSVKYGWLKLWGLLVGLTILSTAAAPAGSIEGFIYTTLPLQDHLKGYLEVVPQTGFLALILCKWYEHPKSWINILMIVLVSIMSLMSIMGVLANLGVLTVD
jgi:hypothetical protein